MGVALVAQALARGEGAAVVTLCGLGVLGGSGSWSCGGPAINSDFSPECAPTAWHGMAWHGMAWHGIALPHLPNMAGAAPSRSSTAAPTRACTRASSHGVASHRICPSVAHALSDATPCQASSRARGAGSPHCHMSPASAACCRPATYQPTSIAYHRTIAYHCMPLHTIAYHRIPSHAIAYHRIPSHTIAYHRIPSHTIAYHRIP
jgi:hypothetical protein